MESRIIEVIKEQFPSHNPDYAESDPEKERRESLPEDLKKVEEILDKTIRPGLQGTVATFKPSVTTITSCWSATKGPVAPVPPP